MQTIDSSFDLRQTEFVAIQLKLFANADRLKILCVLKDGELCVQKIEELSQIQQPTLSQQLTILRKAESVQTRRDGKQIFYEIQDQRVLKLMGSLYAIYCQK